MSARHTLPARLSGAVILCGLLITGGMITSHATPAEDEEALFRQWLSAFAELKRGEVHAEDEHWPNAIARYRSSLTAFEGLAADYPEYQMEIVQYRIGNLAERIDEAQRTLEAQFAEIAAEYDQAVEQIEQAQNLEAAGLDEDGYRGASRAIHRLKTLALEHPEFYADSLLDSLDRAEEIAGRLRTELLAMTDGKERLSAIELELSKELPELETSPLPNRPDIMMSADLFPSTIGGVTMSGNG